MFSSRFNWQSGICVRASANEPGQNGRSDDFERGPAIITHKRGACPESGSDLERGALK